MTTRPPSYDPLRLNPTARREQGRAQSLEALLEIERRKSYRPGWARHVYQARLAKRARA